MSRLLIRADAGVQIGIGHVMRCLALAQTWRDSGGDVTFLSHCENKSLRERIRGMGFNLISINNPHPSSSDLETTLSLIEEPDVEWIIVDGYHFSPDYHKKVKQTGCRLLIIDDMAHLPEYPADILLNQNIDITPSVYTTDSRTRLLLGTHYALLRPEFMSWRKRTRQIKPLGSRVLVTLGGSDPDNVTLRIVEALAQIDLPGFEARIVVGSANPHFENLKRAVQNISYLRLLIDVPDMPSLMHWADLAVCAGGSTCWELAFMGVPAIITILADNQRGNAEGLQKAGMAVNLGMHEQITTDVIAATLVNLMTDRDRRIDMSLAARKQVDGRGSDRVVQAMTEPDDNARLKIRPATLRDAEWLLQLANDPLTRKNSFSPGPIRPDHHANWLREKLSSDQSRIWIFEQHGKMLAQVRCDKTGAEIAEIDFAVVPEYRGLGLGTKALALICRAACAELKLKRLIGIVFTSNIASQRAFHRAGFRTVASNIQIGGRDCSKFEFTLKEDL